MNIRRIYQDNNLHIQQTNYTCGPCALLNILLLKGGNSHDEQTIASLCAAKPGIGTENEALLAAAQELGLKVVLSKANADLSDIENHLDQDHYVVVNYLHAFGGGGHYGLITEYDADSFYLRDSSFGFLRLKKQDFLKHWYNSDKTIPRWAAVFK